ncbi:UDP-N-acetylmuramoyl-L-alanine--D-glutamate ligase [Candidatus Amarolinea aalborgensis]|jgi:UDP-N-acetylmuramoylalanine--D-glutamate ligase|uniref:UDP-N-acetylmuramoyl-L-alanine--D-glutamate ligase n=1 Tax=Candidatus Amarolinea aalborgensis TaxID=2249329 RepID=UPI003BFA2661
MMMDSSWFRGKHIVILGLARQGAALARFLCAVGARVTISDVQAADAPALAASLAAVADLPVALALGSHPLSLLDDADVLCLSGGVSPDIPIVQAARARRIPLSNDSLLTLQQCPAFSVGITGSSGKTTTTTLTGEMLKASGLTTWVGGNIGVPLIDRLDAIAADDRVVLELSSFQLELFDSALCLGAPVSTRVAGILNVTPNHLDRHPSMAAYAAAKYNLARHQRPGDVLVLGLDNDICGAWYAEALAAQPAAGVHVLGFSLVAEPRAGAFLRGGELILRLPGQSDQVVCRAADVRLRGMHNIANLLAAFCLSGSAGASVEAMAAVASTFTGVAHRLELVRMRQGVAWYNDSIATAPERTIAALHSFAEPIVLLAGGRDKHLPWESLALAVRGRVRHLITFGEAAGLIQRALTDFATAHPEAPGAPPVVHHTDSLTEAVALAAACAQPGEVVLLSPGGTSYDAYRDFAARGEHFRALVHALPPMEGSS